jgi:hypothetical protein
MAMTPYMRRYSFRILGFSLAYVGALIGAIMIMKQPWAPTGAAAWALAILPAIPVVGMIWAIFRLVAEIDDEYQRFLLVKQILIATGLTLVIATIWGFLENFDQVSDVPAYYVTILWFAMLGVGGAVARIRA